MKNKQDYEAKLNKYLSLTLVEVSSVVADTTDAGLNQPFSVLFSSNEEKGLEQGTYTLQLEDGMELALFIVPIGPDDTGMRYEAVFT